LVHLLFGLTPIDEIGKKKFAVEAKKL